MLTSQTVAVNNNMVIADPYPDGYGETASTDTPTKDPQARNSQLQQLRNKRPSAHILGFTICTGLLEPQRVDHGLHPR